MTRSNSDLGSQEVQKRAIRNSSEMAEMELFVGSNGLSVREHLIYMVSGYAFPFDLESFDGSNLQNLHLTA